MSRVRVHEVSSPISLFPFIGILLCTMGALLVVLVAVSRSARDTAVEHVKAKQPAAKADVDVETQQKLADARQYMGKLAAIRSEAERKLRDENARLSHVEDHIRRLHEKLRALQISAEELEGLEQDHYDDREQAERETARLNKLIEEARKTIDTLEEAADKEPASYALVPYEGPNGTFRRPIYIECIKDGLILQPEGVRISASDLRPPIGAGNPLAAALRAARDHYVKLYPKEGKSRDTEPYPLLLVRPDGLLMFDRARQAIEAGDFDLGFELAETDWKLKYPQPNPQLAGIEQVAVDQARARQEVLAAAAPTYGRKSMTFEDRYGADDDDSAGNDGTGGYGGGYGGGGYGGGGNGGGSQIGGGGRVGSGPPGSPSGQGGASGPTGYAAGGVGGGGNSSSATSSGNAGAGTGGGGMTSRPGGVNGVGGGVPGGAAGSETPGTQTAGAGNVVAGGSPGGPSSAGNTGTGGSLSSSGSGMPAIPMTDPNAPPDSPDSSKNVSVMMGSPPPDADPSAHFDPRGPRDKSQMIPPEQRGKDWALHKKGPRAVPVRRTIRVVVRQDQVAIAKESSADALSASAETVVRFHGDTVQSVDELVKNVQREIDGWGIAGNGLYWRPVLILSVAPDGSARANDLTRLLKNSGLELQTDEVARNASPGGPHETR